MNEKEQIEFNNIIKDIISNNDFDKLQHECHHGISRYDHCMHVAEKSYLYAKKHHYDYVKVTRAALLHDFYTNEDTRAYNKRETLRIHPKFALKNANKYFKLDDMEQNIIVSHMYPLKGEKPRYKESYIVSVADKLVATKEMYH